MSLWSIPACAGEPLRDGRRAHTLKVYPRVCGGTEDSARIDGRGQGLSPRVRGNRVATPVNLCTSGSIPACAGEPCTHSTADTATAVYPRVCGGTPLRDLQGRHVRGLSPRVRGNRSVAH